MAQPKLGTLIDRLYRQKLKCDEQRDIIKKEEGKLAKLQAKYKEMEDHIIETLPKEKIDGVFGKLAKVQLKQSVKPTVVNWDKFYAYVHKNKSYFLLQRRVNEKAWKEVKEETGKLVPGTQTFTYKRLSLTKV